LNILLGVHQFFPDHYTGTERYVLNLAKQLQKMGHRTKVLTYSVLDRDGFREGYAPNILRKEYVYEGIQVVSLRHREKRDDHAFCFDLIDEDFYNESMNIFKENNFDIYHCAHPFRISASVKAARNSGVKVVFMVTDYWLMCPLGIMRRSDNTLCEGPDDGRNCLGHCFAHLTDEPIRKRISESHKLIESCDCLLSPSRFLIRLFNNTGHIPSDRFLLSRHGFDYTKRKDYFIKEPKGTITFGYIGTIQHHKGVHIMVEGFKKSPHQNIRLQVWGGCFHELEYRRNLMEMAGGDSRIEFKGSYNFNDIEGILKPIDVVIVPSIWYENAPLTISTSLAYGIPVVTSDIGGMKEMIKDGHNGLTFKVEDPADLSTKIGLIADNPDLIVKFKQNIRYPIRVEEEAFNTEMVYRELLS
jgi:glycosyltransferase involved in cell wall biosynthesis